MTRTTRGPKAIRGVHTPVSPETIPVEPVVTVTGTVAQPPTPDPRRPLLIEELADGTRVRHYANGDVIVETPTAAPYRAPTS